MKESYVEGLASYGGPESCVHIREGVGEALTGVRAGRVSSREIHAPRRRAAGGPGCRGRGATPKATPVLPYWRGSTGPRAVTDPAHARKHLAREPGDPASFCGCSGEPCRRAHREAQGRTTMSHGRGKSDRGVVPKKLPNKAAGEAPAAAEVVEGRLRAKGNAVRRACPADRCGCMTWKPRSTAYDRRQEPSGSEVHGPCCITSTRSSACGRPTCASSAMPLPGWTARPGQLRAEPGGQPPGPVRPAGPRGLPAPACEEGVHRQGRRE